MGFGDWNCLWVSWLRLVESEKRDWLFGLTQWVSRRWLPKWRSSDGLGWHDWHQVWYGFLDVGVPMGFRFLSRVRTSSDHPVEKSCWESRNCHLIICYHTMSRDRERERERERETMMRMRVRDSYTDLYFDKTSKLTFVLLQHFFFFFVVEEFSCKFIDERKKTQNWEISCICDGLLLTFRLIICRMCCIHVKTREKGGSKWKAIFNYFRPNKRFLVILLLFCRKIRG